VLHNSTRAVKNNLQRSVHCLGSHASVTSSVLDIKFSVQSNATDHSS
jgi:hypothetical protein